MDPLKSPGTPWKRPSDVMKKFRKSRKRSSCKDDESNGIEISPKSKKKLSTSFSGTFNPFKCQKSNKTGSIFQTISPKNVNKIPSVFSEFRNLEKKMPDRGHTKLLSINNVIFADENASDTLSQSQEHNEIWNKHLPIDWSLKSKVRFLSKKPFSWTGNLKTSEEASGITGFVRCLASSSNSPEQECRLDTSTNAQFHQCCLIWKHPHFSWLKLFPRHNNALKSSEVSIFAGNQEIQDTLYADWCESFRSLYQLVRARQCPYFYVCCHSFTILFRAAGISGINDIHAFLTPSTRGLREVLRQEGVVFTLPLKKSSKGSSGIVSDNTLDYDGESSSQLVDLETNHTDEENEEDENDEAISWLETMGLETTSFPELNLNKIKLKKEKSKVDHIPESLLYVEGVEAQGLFNFLLNNKNCISSTGPFAGIPPTLLAPTAFQGATLAPLQARQAYIKQDDKNNYHAIQLSGPLLPHVIYQLCELFKNSQDGQFTAIFATLDQTAPFTLFNSKQPNCPAPSVFAQQSLTDCGLPTDLLSAFCAAPTTSSIIQNLKVEKSQFSCS